MRPQRLKPVHAIKQYSCDWSLSDKSPNWFGKSPIFQQHQMVHVGTKDLRAPVKMLEVKNSVAKKMFAF